MQYVLSNGLYYINVVDGKILKTKLFEDAKKFPSERAALRRKGKAKAQCASYRTYSLEQIGINGKIIYDNPKICKRRYFTQEERQQIYRKTNGHCYLCGEFVDYEKFEIEHKKPLANGGTNDFSNLFPSCHTCNTLKGSIEPEDLLEKIKQIHLFQIEEKCGKGLRWKVLNFLLEIV